jgi:hypothetical protein
LQGSDYVRVLVLLAAAAAAACGQARPSGPTRVAAAATPATPPPFPAGLDPIWVRTVGSVDSNGIPKRWAGGPFHHCFAPDVDQAVLEQVAERMSALTGIPRTATGSCNVEWVVEDQTPQYSAHATLWGTATAISRARVAFATDRAARSFTTALHEGGHVLGLDHSPREGDLMAPSGRTRGEDFSGDELALLAWVYGREGSRTSSTATQFPTPIRGLGFSSPNQVSGSAESSRPGVAPGLLRLVALYHERHFRLVERRPWPA